MRVTTAKSGALVSKLELVKGLLESAESVAGAVTHDVDAVRPGSQALLESARISQAVRLIESAGLAPQERVMEAGRGDLFNVRLANLLNRTRRVIRTPCS